MRVCPKCKKHYEENPALSRIDNKTEICPNCGINEALEIYVKFYANCSGIEIADSIKDNQYYFFNNNEYKKN